MAAVSALSTTGFAGVSRAKDSTTTMSDIGITETVLTHIADREYPKAKEILKKNEIPSMVSVKRPNWNYSNDDELSIGPNWHYTELGGDVAAYLILDGDPNKEGEWLAGGQISFPSEEAIDGAIDLTSVGRPANANDGAALVFDSSEYTAVDPSDEGVVYNNDPGRLTMHHESFNPNYGVCAEVEYHHSLPHENGGSATATMETRLTKSDTGNQNVPIQFAYEHITASSSTGSVTVSLNTGILSVNIPIDAQTVWRDETSADPLFVHPY